jgi:hypothetical protein
MRTPLALAIALATALAALAASAPAQSVADRVAAARDGSAELRFPSRSGVCGDGEDVVAFRESIFIGRGVESHGGWHGVDCAPGPVRVRLTIRGGRVAGIRTAVGEGRGRADAPDTDLGVVDAREASTWLLGVAERAEGRVAADAVLPAVLADAEGLTPALLRLARDERRPREARQRALHWAGMLGEPGSLAAIAGITTDAGAGAWLREHAILALGHHADAPAAARMLRDLYGRLPAGELRERAVMAIGQHEDEESGRWLMARARDRREATEVRRQAIFWTGQRDATDVAELVRLYGALEERELREHAIFVLSDRDEREATDALMTIARSDPDRELRKKALFWLGQSDDPRARQFLRDMINQ